MEPPSWPEGIELDQAMRDVMGPWRARLARSAGQRQLNGRRTGADARRDEQRDAVAERFAELGPVTVEHVREVEPWRQELYAALAEATSEPIDTSALREHEWEDVVARARARGEWPIKPAR